MDPDATRQAMGLSGIAGGLFWGLHQMAAILLAKAPLSRVDALKALANVAFGVMGGALVAYYLGPVVASYVPVEQLREPRGLGFVIGLCAWEVAPFLIRSVRGRAAQIAKLKTTSAPEAGQ